MIQAIVWLQLFAAALACCWRCGNPATLLLRTTGRAPLRLLLFVCLVAQQRLLLSQYNPPPPAQYPGNVTVITSSNVTSWTVPPNVYSIKARMLHRTCPPALRPCSLLCLLCACASKQVWAIGGGGGGAVAAIISTFVNVYSVTSTYTSGISSGAGSGGGGGGVAFKTLSVSPGQVLSLAIGSGGAGGNASAGMTSTAIQGGAGSATSVTLGGVSFSGLGGAGGTFACSAGGGQNNCSSPPVSWYTNAFAGVGAGLRTRRPTRPIMLAVAVAAAAVLVARTAAKPRTARATVRYPALPVPLAWM